MPFHPRRDTGRPAGCRSKKYLNTSSLSWISSVWGWPWTLPKSRNSSSSWMSKGWIIHWDVLLNRVLSATTDFCCCWWFNGVIWGSVPWWLILGALHFKICIHMVLPFLRQPPPALPKKKEKNCVNTTICSFTGWCITCRTTTCRDEVTHCGVITVRLPTSTPGGHCIWTNNSESHNLFTKPRQITPTRYSRLTNVRLCMWNLSLRREESLVCPEIFQLFNFKATAATYQKRKIVLTALAHHAPYFRRMCLYLWHLPQL